MVLGQLGALKRPVDLVGHDWGGLLVVRAVSVRPGAVRTWAVGGAPLDREYVWHKAAQAWQTPGVGERVMAAMTPEGMTAALVAAGVPPVGAAATAGQLDATMKQCILTRGGGLSYTHSGMYDIFPIIEAARQLRRECGARQVPNCKVSLVNGMGGMLSAAGTLALSSER